MRYSLPVLAVVSQCVSPLAVRLVSTFDTDYKAVYIPVRVYITTLAVVQCV